jgi:hypothetical protein
VRRKTTNQNSTNHYCCMFCRGGNYPYDKLQIVSTGDPPWWVHERCYHAFAAELDATNALSTAIKSLKGALRELRQQSAYRKEGGKTKPAYYVPLHKNQSRK